MEEKKISKIFTISVLLKAINAVLEIIAGILFFFTGAITNIISYLARAELIEDPSDFLANKIQHYLPYLSEHTQLFTAFYLLSHGIIKLFLVVGLLRRRLWAYPSAILVFILFILYQLYRYTLTHSIFLIFLTLFDLFVVWLTWHEYQIIKKHLS